MGEKTVSIIILNYNTFEKSRKCIDSCLKQKGVSCRVFLIDNSSSDTSFERLQDLYGEKIDYIQNDHNLGYAKGNNVAVDLCKNIGYKYSLILNSDTELVGEFLVCNLIKIFEQYPQCGVIAPEVFDVTSFGNIPHLNDSFYLKLLRFVRVIPHNRIISDNITTVSEAHGSALMVANDLFLKLGGFPEHFFMYTEECLFSKKILWEGKYIFWYKREGEYILHHHDKSGEVEHWRSYLMGRNRSLEYYENKDYHSRMWFLAFWLFFLKIILSSIFSNYYKDYCKGMKNGRFIHMRNYSGEEILRMGEQIRLTYKG